MSLAPVAVARVTTVCPLSQCMLVHLDSFKGSNPVWRGPRATSEPVDGRVRAWTRLALGHDHRNVCERIGRDQPTRTEEGKSQ